MNGYIRFLLAGLMLAGSAVGISAYEANEPGDCAGAAERFVFSWPIGNDCHDRPRGGTSTGAPVTPDPAAHPGWLAIQEAGLSRFERDRRAILAMAGPYRVTFDFLETAGFGADFERDRPYQSWGTEYIYVIEDRGSFISLQHIMVMYFEAEGEQEPEPVVMKHWRQDWTYEDDTLLVFDHDSRWQKEAVGRAERTGRWSQAVFQVDDSPRYESIGRWEHNGSFSSWRSERTRRPLPRRESSVRDDYDVLEGFNRHTITRDGWLQEEENLKLVVDGEGAPDSALPYLARELGVARYRRIIGTDFTPGDRYMALAGRFWTDVRDAWDAVLAAGDTLVLREAVDGVPLFAPLFEYAEAVMQAGEYDAPKGSDFARKTLDDYVVRPR
jgi:hypothetical protein